MSKIILQIEDIELGYLSNHNNKFMFCANNNQIEKARTEFPLDMLLFKLNSKGIEIYDTLPYPFNTFLSGTEREDLVQKANINEGDSDFLKIYKLAGLNLIRENFEIHQAD